MPPRKKVVKGTTIIQGDVKFIVDNEDAPWVNAKKWSVDPNGYIVSLYKVSGVKHPFATRLHREVWKRRHGDPKGFNVIHINEDFTDNRIENLELKEREPPI